MSEYYIQPRMIADASSDLVILTNAMTVNISRLDNVIGSTREQHSLIQLNRVLIAIKGQMLQLVDHTSIVANVLTNVQREYVAADQSITGENNFGFVPYSQEPYSLNNAIDFFKLLRILCPGLILPDFWNKVILFHLGYVSKEEDDNLKSFLKSASNFTDFSLSDLDDLGLNIGILKPVAPFASLLNKFIILANVFDCRVYWTVYARPRLVYRALRKLFM